ncbi:uncharacterized protein LOC125263474 isoform X2 [Megalobrama amblycephala]|uniref:uncharacterized protein LOC125263474 isoform X2 n=1 Tax=Megalobrama amblycephala TaxID=75352 RepID=UPI00201440CE|nr:uncharacterized protein LOC125263474 isoform X2 [Megalobrama amblycephala]
MRNVIWIWTRAKQSAIIVKYQNKHRYQFQGFFGVGSDVSVIEGDSVTLYTDQETIQQEEIRWYFNDAPITEITGDPNNTCTDVQCNEGTERLRDRLKLDHQTGSLTITNIKTTDSGLYKLQISSSSDSLSQLFHISVYDVSDSERDEVKGKSVMKGESVTLHPGVVKHPNYLMKWVFNDVRIAEINGDLSFICTDAQCLYADERFRDRLKLNHMTGSLTITNTRTGDSGEYKLLISTIRFSIIKSFIVNVNGFVGVDTEKVTVMDRDSVTLNTNVETNQQEEIRWYFYDIRVAQITRDLSFICTDVQCKYSDERFRDRLKLDHQTGSLTITNTRSTDSGDYHLEIFSSSSSSLKTFSVSVYDETKRNSMKELESVCVSAAAVAGICAAAVLVVLLLVAAAAVIYRRKRQAGQNEIRMQCIDQMNVVEESSLTLSCQ